jgi:hypothetical protein
VPTLLSTSKNKQNTQQNTHRARHSTPQENPPQSNAISGARIFYTGVFFPQRSGTPEHETEGKSGREGRGEKEKRRETLRIFFFVGAGGRQKAIGDAKLDFHGRFAVLPAVRPRARNVRKLGPQQVASQTIGNWVCLTFGASGANRGWAGGGGGWRGESNRKKKQ